MPLTTVTFDDTTIRPLKVMAMLVQTLE